MLFTYPLQHVFFSYQQGKLDGYKAEMAKGKTLDGDQKAAIAKYDDVLIGLVRFYYKIYIHSPSFTHTVATEELRV